MIELCHVTCGYGARIVFRDLSVSFSKGELTCVIGVNGCGKSTLLKAALGLISVQNGNVFLENTALCDMNRCDIARKAAYLPQEKGQVDMTVEQLVLHGRFPHLHYPRRYTHRDYDIAHSAMEQMGLSQAGSLPLSHLSGGMRQNAYIAMALAQDTDFIFLDEPTTYLDIANQLTLMKKLRFLAQNGRGIVVVMHDLPMALSFSDRVVLLHNGGIACSDTPDGIYQSNSIPDIFGVTLIPSPNGTGYAYRF